MPGLSPPPARVPADFANNPALFGYFNELHAFLRQLSSYISPSSGLGGDITEIHNRLMQLNSYAQAATGIESDSPHRYSLPIGERTNNVPNYYQQPIAEQTNEKPPYALPAKRENAPPRYTQPVTEKSDPVPRVAPALPEPNRIPMLFNVQPEAFEYISTATALTTSRNMIIKATDAITITLNPTPDQKEVVVVVRDTAAGAVTLDGTPNNINSSPTRTISLNYGATVVMYLDDRWFVLA